MESKEPGKNPAFTEGLGFGQAAIKTTLYKFFHGSLDTAQP